jgi:hypothetical protein
MNVCTSASTTYHDATSASILHICHAGGNNIQHV